MTSNSNFPFRSLRLGLAIIFTLFMAVASWAADGSKIYKSSVQDKSRLSIGGYQVSQGGSWSSTTPVVLTDDDIQIQTANTLGHDGYYICLNNQKGSFYKDFDFTISSPNETKYIKRVTIHYLHKTGSTEYTASATAASATGPNVHTLTASVSVERQTEYRLLSFEVEFTDEPYYSVKPAEGLEIVNTDDACLVDTWHNGFTGVTTTTYYFHPNTSITIAPTSAVQVITKVTTPTTGATIASDKRSFSFAMPQSNITPSATLEEAYSVALTGNVSISEPLFTDGDTRYYKSGEKITITAKTDEIIDGITGIENYTIAADQKYATFTMPTSDLTLAVATSEVHTMSVPSGMTLSDPYITIGDVKYYKKGETYTLTAPQYNIIYGFTAMGAQSSSVSADKRSATVTIGSANVTATATLFEVHTMSVPSDMTLSSDPFVTIGDVKYYKKGETYTLTAPQYNIIESFTATGAQSSSVYSDKRRAMVTVGNSDVDPIAELTEVHTVTAQDGITLSEAYTNILGTDYYKYGQKVEFGISGSGSVAYYVNGKRIDGNSVTVGHKNLTVQMDVSYIDENGKEQVRKPGEYTVLTKNTLVSNLPAGWYVVQGEVSYTSQVYFSDNAYLILADGAKMEIETEGESESAIQAYRNLKIYGQSGQSGILKATAKGSDRFGISGNLGVAISGGNISATSGMCGIFSRSGNITINGGTVTATSENYGIHSKDIMISGGTVTATGNNYGIDGYNGVTISGGTVTATGGIRGIDSFNGNITLSWAKSTDAVKASSYRLGDSEKHVIIADGKSFTDEDGNVYSGTLNDDQLSAIKGKTLTPAPVKYIDENGEEKSVVDYTVLTSTTDVSNLPGGWYVVQGEVSYTTQVKFSEDAYLILADGAKLEIETEGDFENGITVSEHLTIYGQSGQSGMLKTTAKGLNSYGINGYEGVTIIGGKVIATGEKVSGINGNDITISGGVVTATGKFDGINGYGGVTISGGNVTATSESGDCIYGQNGVTISGGTVTATSENGSGIYGYNGVTISGGTVTATSENGSGIYSHKGVTISGGTVTATGNNYGIRASKGDITLSWTNPTDYIKASSYYCENGSVIIADGKSFTDEDGKVYSGTLNSAQLSAIKGKTLTPASIKYVDENGNEKSIYEYTVLTAEMAANELPGGWYVLENSDPNYTDLYLKSTLWFSGDVNLILADDADMGVVVEKGDAINVAGKLTVYGQSNQTGTLYAIGSENGINAENGIVVNGGCVKAYGGEYKYGFNGGENGVDIHLKHYNSYILGSSYREPVTVSGLALHGYENNGIYEGDLDKAQIENMAYQYQQLEPCYVVKFDKDNNTDPEFLAATFNKEGVAHVAKPEVPTREGYTFLEWVDKSKADSTPGVIRKRFDFTAPVKQNTYVYAKWWKNDPVQYVAYDPDEGKVVTKTVEDYTVLTPWTDVSKGLPAEWYIVVNSNEDEEDDEEVDLRFTKQLDFNSETTHIILMDDAQMVVGDDMNSAIHANVLNIYGQSIGSGKLIVNSESWAIEAGSFNIYGGIVHAFGKLVGIYSYNTAHLYGGYVYVANGNYGIYVNKGDLILDWTRKDDGYNINSYAVFDGGSVIVADGKYFKDEKGHIYVGMLSSNQVEAISQQVIKPLPWKNVGNYAAVQIFEDEKGKKHAVIEGEYDGTDAVNIGTDISVNEVEFIREFTVNLENGGFSTIMLPFDIKAENLTGVKSIFEFDGVDNNAVGVKYVWCNATIGKEEEKKHPDRNCNKYSGELNAYTPYMVEMETPTLGIKDAVTLKSNSGKIVGDAPKGNWVFRGTLQKKKWSKEDDDIKNGQIWAFAGSARNGASIGKFVQFGGNNWVNPFRAYLVDCTTYPDPDASESKDNQPKPSLVSRYRFADVLAPASSAENSLSAKTPAAVAASETASLNSMDIVIVYGDSASGERPTVIGRMNPATGEIRMLPRTKQTYDLKGRRVGNGKKAKGAYYRK